MAKKVRLSDDNGVNWYTLPGNSGEMTNEAGEITDTVFGQDYASSQPGLISWAVNANGLYKGFAGYVAKILKSGTSTAMTTEAMSLVSGKTYQVTAPTKRTFNRGVALTFFDNAAPVAGSNILNVDYLFGRVTFTASYTPSGPITVTGAYFPMTQIAKGRTFTLTQTAATIETTDFETAQANTGIKTFDYGLKTVNLEIGGVFSATNAYRTLLAGRAEALIEIGPDGSGLSVARGFFRPANTGQRGNVGELEEENINWRLSVPDVDVLAYPFAWLHDATTTLNMSLQKAITAWQNKTTIDVQYLWDGTNGAKGDVVVTDLTLAGGLETMNTFTVRLQGTGAQTAVP